MNSLSTDELVSQALSSTDLFSDGYAAVLTLLQHESQEVLETAIGLTWGQSARERALGAHLLGHLGHSPECYHDERVAAVLRLLVTEQSVPALIAVGYACQQLRDARCIPLLIARKDYPDPAVRQAVCAGLAGHDDPNAIAALIELSMDADRDVRHWATFALARQFDADTPEIRAALCDRLRDPDPDTRGEALVGLACRGEAQVVELLFSDLVDGANPAHVDEAFIEAGKRLGDPQLLPELQRLRSETAMLYSGVEYPVADDEEDDLLLAIRCCE